MGKRRREDQKMGRAPCCDKDKVKKGAWTPEEDKILVDYIAKNGHGTWRSLPKLAGLLRCGKSCRLRWMNYLRPDIKRGAFTYQEEQTIIQLRSMLGNKWAAIASQLPGRTDNEIKNFWNSHLKKRISRIDLNLQTYSPFNSRDMKSESPSTCHMADLESATVEAEARMSMDPLLLNPSSSTGKTSYCDYFLRMWNSDVGTSFRTIKDGSPISQTSSLVKLESGSAVTMQDGPTKIVTSTDASDKHSFKGQMNCKNEAEEVFVGSDYSNSNEESSSDIELNLLLDFPSDGNYLEYLQGETDDYSTFLQQ